MKANAFIDLHQAVKYNIKLIYYNTVNRRQRVLF